MSKYLGLKLVSYVGLALSLGSSVLAFRSALSLQTYYLLMFVGMIMWFGPAIFWIKPDHSNR